MAVILDAGRSLVATALQTPGVSAGVSFVGIGTGCGTLALPVTSGSGLSSLPLDAGLPANLSGGQQLTVTDGTNSETVTVAAGGALASATSIPINTWIPANNYAAHTTAVAPIPQTSDLALYNEVARVAANPGVPGASAGESLNSGYFDGTQPSGVYMLVGYFGGSTATSSTATGTLIVADIQYWNHTLNADSASFLLDSTL